MQKYIITITRQFGSLGRPIAKHMSELLNIEYYDRHIVEETAKKMNLPISFISNEEEIAKAKWYDMKYPLGLGTTATQDDIFRAQEEIIRSIANKSDSCIFVGRCSDHILQNYNNCVNIFIYAPYEKRLQNCIEILHMQPEEAKKMISEVDKARSSYYKHYTKHLPEDYNYKHILVDSSSLGVEGTANMLTNMIKTKFYS